MEVALWGDTEQMMFSKYIVYEFRELGKNILGSDWWVWWNGTMACYGGLPV